VGRRAPQPDGPFDPGLQHERTQLAWTRTALGFLLNGALVLRLAPSTRPAALGYALAAILMTTGAGVWVYAQVAFSRRLADLIAHGSVAPARAVRLVWSATAFSALVASAVSLTTLIPD
jgi:uncharacterized membrane protein YidH (DUF202 family)